MFLPTSFKYKSSLLLKEFTECASAMSFEKLFHVVDILLRRKCVRGSFPLVRYRESWGVFGQVNYLLVRFNYLIFFTPVYFLKTVYNLVYLDEVTSLSLVVFRSVKPSLSSLFSYGK